MKLTTIAIAATLGVTSAQAALTSLNFDGAVDTAITNGYSGLTFRSPVAANDPVPTWSVAGAATPGNVLSLGAAFPIIQADGQIIDSVFVTAVSIGTPDGGGGTIPESASAVLTALTLGGLALTRRRPPKAVACATAWATPNP